MFSWEENKKQVIENKIIRAKIMAKNPISNDGTINDYSIKYPQEVKDAIAKQFKTLELRIRKEVSHQQLMAMERRLKLVRKD